MTSGIYVITCTANGKRYVGSSKDIRKRWNSHRNRLKLAGHHNSFLQYAWDKYGPEAFAFRVIEEVAVGVLIARELFWIAQLKPEFNLDIPDIDQAGFTCSDVTRKRHSEAIKGMHMKHKGQPWSDARRAAFHGSSTKGKARSEEVKRKISETKRARMNDETKRRISEGHKKMWAERRERENARYPARI